MLLKKKILIYLVSKNKKTKTIRFYQKIYFSKKEKRSYKKHVL